MTKTIVITNRKGGCGKSVTTASLGVGLARQGKRYSSSTPITNRDAWASSGAFFAPRPATR
ncbi:MAG: hypothetical protein LBS19_03645 [Clostridiales bacterium]|nr:hypothetical protein [Clostridiales bacterium]